jgi:hypothetical protein
VLMLDLIYLSCYRQNALARRVRLGNPTAFISQAHAGQLSSRVHGGAWTPEPAIPEHRAAGAAAGDEAGTGWGPRSGVPNADAAVCRPRRQAPSLGVPGDAEDQPCVAMETLHRRRTGL